ncbi:MAG: acyclic terpene utilization AtuA family protein [Hyphomicrobium sp.]|nr:acyclic terpene utilization AtuA family protein [Hyphomicrobium sp.]
MAPYRIYSATGVIGMSFPEESVQAVIEKGVDAVCCDAGSTDPGPAYLAEGRSFFPADVCKRDLSLLLYAARKMEVPLIIGSCGFCGVDAGVDLFAGLVRDAAREQGQAEFKIAKIYSEQSKPYLKSMIASDLTEPLYPAKEALSSDQVERCNHIVASIGVEPYLAALDAGADVILAGRSTDTAIFAAPAMRAGVPEAAAWHAGKLLECGASCAIPQLPFDGVIVAFEGDEFVIEPATSSDSVICTPYSVAAHFMHETASPLTLVEPTGTLDVSAAVYAADSPRAVRVRGGRFDAADRYTLKLEGAEIYGYRTVTVGGVRDPRLTGQLRYWLENDVREIVGAEMRRLYGGKVAPGDYHIVFRLYGTGEIMGTREFRDFSEPREIGVVIEVIAATQAISEAIAVTTRQRVIHGAFPGRKNWLGGNMAVPFPELKGGPAARFVLSHRIAPKRWQDAVRIEYEDVRGQNEAR